MKTTVPPPRSAAFGTTWESSRRDAISRKVVQDLGNVPENDLCLIVHIGNGLGSEICYYTTVNFIIVEEKEVHQVCDLFNLFWRFGVKSKTPNLWVI